MNSYQTYCKPSLSSALSAMGLDKRFHRAQGSQLYYLDQASHKEVEVLDLLGGYGAVLLGHNHPELIKTAVANFQEGRPFNNQFSLRQASGRLAERLNQILREETSAFEDFRFAFCSTGSEAVEIAIGHAEVARKQRIGEIMAEVNFALSSLRRLTGGLQDIPEEFASALGLEPGVSAEELAKAIEEYNGQQLAKKGLFVALKNAFHGKLTGSVQLTHGEAYRGPFAHLGLDVCFIGVRELAGQVEALKQQTLSKVISPKVKKGQLSLDWAELPMISGIFAEPVQGEGGIHCLSEEDARQLHQARDSWQCPLIADEIQSGSGRCGSFLAGKALGLSPDYVILSKALGGGIAKIGLVAIRQSAYVDGFDLIQSSTFGEDEHSAEIALAYIEQLYQDDKDVLVRVENFGEQLISRLEQVKAEFPDVVADVRGRGLLLGVEFKSQAMASSVMFRSMAYQDSLGYMVSGFMLNQHHIRVAPSASAPNVVRMEPNICMTAKDIDLLVDAFTDVCRTLQYQDAYYFLRFLSKDCPQRAQRRELKDFRSQGKPPVLPSPAGEGKVKVAFINHLISTDWLWQVDPSMEGLPLAESDFLVEKMGFDLRVVPLSPVTVKSVQGQEVEFVMYPLSITSAQIEQMLANNDLDGIRQAVNERAQAAQLDGCRVAGLGMFTSVVTNNCKSVRATDIDLTTGNSLTVAMSVEAVVQHLEKNAVEVNKAAVIGAGGNIGSVYASMVSDFSPQLVLIGSGRNGSQKRLLKSAYSIYGDCWDSLVKGGSVTGISEIIGRHPQVQAWLADKSQAPKDIGEQIFKLMEEQAQAPIVLSDEIRDIRDCNLIVCATNASEAFIDESFIQQNAVICDVSVPHNIDEAVIEKRPDLTCIRGGVVKTPFGESLDETVRAYLGAGEVYACMAETLVLGLEGYNGHYSYGDLSKAGVVEMMDMARKHGFSLASAKQQQSM